MQDLEIATAKRPQSQPFRNKYRVFLQSAGHLLD